MVIDFFPLILEISLEVIQDFDSRIFNLLDF